MWRNQADNSSSVDYGGFMKSPATPSTQTDKGKRIRAQNLVPMTVFQIQNNIGADGVLRIGSSDVHMVVICGLVRTVDQQTTHIVYEIDDMTGPLMKVQHWFDDADDSKKPMVLNTYVKVIGTVKSMRGENHIVVFNIRPITDLNELSIHYIQIMDAKRFHTSEPKTQVKTENTAMDLDTSSSSGFNQIQSMVYKAIGQYDSISGCSLETVARSLPTISPIAIKEAVTFLNNEGHIYSTIDDSHFRVTDGAS